VLFLVTFEPPRADFFATLTEEEGATVVDHFEYLVRLHDEGTVKFAGRAEDGKFGMAIVEAESEERATEVMNASPAVLAGLYTGRVTTWNLPVETLGVKY
jgi:uncharacterized protein YciI